MPKLCRSRARLHFNRITRYIYLPRHTTSLNPRSSTTRNFEKITRKPWKLSPLTKIRIPSHLLHLPSLSSLFETRMFRRKCEKRSRQIILSTFVASSKYEVGFSSHDVIQLFYSRAFHALLSSSTSISFCT